MPNDREEYDKTDEYRDGRDVIYYDTENQQHVTVEDEREKKERA